MRVRNQDLTFDIFDYCCSEDTIISSFPIDENESVQPTEKLKCIFWWRSELVLWLSIRPAESKKATFWVAFFKWSRGLPSVFPNGSRTVNATFGLCKTSVLKPKNPMK
tara:strand:- start:254 stop:577 length:324 start_codon:yes stop_codon:yes gene_type:complete